MSSRPLVSFLLEIAASGLIIWMSTRPDIRGLAAGFWLAVWRGARTVAQAAGRLGMRAEVRYFETVKL